MDLCFNSGAGSVVGCVCPWGHARGWSGPGWRALAGLEVPGVSLPTALGAGCDPLSSWTRCVLSKELGSQERRRGLEQGCWDHIGLKALLPHFGVFVGWFFLLVWFFPLNTKRNSGRNISLIFILVFFSRKNLGGKRHVLDKLPVQIS